MPAAERAGIPYYPKLVVGVPFTPATGRRLLVAAGEDRANNAGTRPRVAMAPPSLAKNDLREQCELTVCVRFKIPARRRSPSSNVKQNFEPKR